ncbi:25S rRNA (adenine(645)-N(1))-methyltransferase [Malassezia sp. CBS 17886]|nr:25S rRNA (adenine(645)-N(1))-methyltransferase [Malassezia sp. CBS 17886]
MPDDAIDLGALQQQLQQHRTSLAESILARLPGPGGAAPAPKPVHEKAPRRPATLGVGATRQAGDQTALSAADQKLQAQLGGAAKRTVSGGAGGAIGGTAAAASRTARAVDDDGDADADDEPKKGVAGRKRARKADPWIKGRGAGAKGGGDAKKVRVGDAAKEDGGAGADGAPKDKGGPPEMRPAEAQRKDQHTVRPSGETSVTLQNGSTHRDAPADTDTSGMSKTQRKKWNKRQREEAGRGGDAGASQGDPRPQHEPVAADARQTGCPRAAAASNVPPDAARTALQSSMATSLKGARFRAINEQLYTMNSGAAYALLQGEPQLFGDYHDGFRQQVRKWPKNPVDSLVELLRGTHGAAKGGKEKRGAQAAPGMHVRATAQPGALIVDVGAGEAGLAQKLVPSGFHVLSYDLVDSADGWVRGIDAAQIGALPLPGTHRPLGIAWDGAAQGADGVADAVVFCLSLMGTNWANMISEAWRVLRTGGALLVAEVASRLGADGRTDAFTDLICALGFTLDGCDARNTHFTLFQFTKVRHERTSEASGPFEEPRGVQEFADAVASEAHAAAALDALVRRGEGVLKPCLYKRR